MELEDLAYPLLAGVVATSDLQEAFTDIEYAVFLGAFPRKQGMERKDLLEKNIAIFKEQGVSLAKFAKQNCRVSLCTQKN
jgi:malate/lactate dehydrogenase